jgi:hypothetical protein
MAFPQSNSFNTGSGAASGAGAGALDTIIRGELKVTDPRDAAQIATALMARYKDDPRTNAITQEAKGLPFLLASPTPAPPPISATSSDVELHQATSDVERSLQDLSGSALLDDVLPELGGWAQAIRAAIDDGSAAARFGLDPRQRDKVFAVRRQLGDYARMARLVGQFTPAMNANYRKLATSIDEVAAVILVMLGEALANVGFSSGEYLLQVPFTELQARRDAVIFALRNLLGTTQQAYGPDDWPRGINVYRRLFEDLEREGQGDLRTLLVENELAHTMDQLIQRAGQGSAEGLRALGATVQIDLDRFRRLAIIGRGLAQAEPPLASFLEALMLFADGFESAGGFRLLRIARPPILLYGLYNPQQNDAVLETLLQLLVIARGQLATQSDCLTCECTADSMSFQALLDFIVYTLDRAIDLLAIERGPLRRAIAHFIMAEEALSEMNAIANRVPAPLNRQLQRAGTAVDEAWSMASIQLWRNRFRTATLSLLREIQQEVRIQNSVEIRWNTIVSTMVASCPERQLVFDELGVVLDHSFARVGLARRPTEPQDERIAENLPPQFERSLDRIARTF